MFPALGTGLPRLNIPAFPSVPAHRSESAGAYLWRRTSLYNGGSLNALGDASLVSGQGITLSSVTAQVSQDIERHDYSRQASQTSGKTASGGRREAC